MKPVLKGDICPWENPAASGDSPMTSKSHLCQVIVTKKETQSRTYQKENKIKSVMEKCQYRSSLVQAGLLCATCMRKASMEIFVPHLMQSRKQSPAGPALQTGPVLNLAGCPLLQLPGLRLIVPGPQATFKT